MTASLTKAMVLAAGLGTRMRPLTLATPKPLVQVNGKALLDWTLDGLKAGGVEHFVINTHWLGDQITAHMQSRDDVTVSPEDPVLETGGGIEHALPLLGDGPFLAANTDTILTPGKLPPAQRLADAWDDAAMDGLLLLHPTHMAHGYEGHGDFHLSDDGRLTRREPETPAPYVFTGTQVLHPRLFAGAPGGVYSLNVLYDKALKAGRLYGLVHDGGWYHVGTIASIVETEALL